MTGPVHHRISYYRRLGYYLHFPRKPELPILRPLGKLHLNECDAPKFRRERFGFAITDGYGAQAQLRENPIHKLFGAHGLALSWFGQAVRIEPSLEKHKFSRTSCDRNSAEISALMASIPSLPVRQILSESAVTMMTHSHLSAE